LIFGDGACGLVSWTTPDQHGVIERLCLDLERDLAGLPGAGDRGQVQPHLCGLALVELRRVLS